MAECECLLRVVLHHSTRNWDSEGHWLQLVRCACLLSMSLYFICKNSGSRKSEGQRNVASFTGSQESGSRMEVGNLEVGIWKLFWKLFWKSSWKLFWKSSWKLFRKSSQKSEGNQESGSWKEVRNMEIRK